MTEGTSRTTGAARAPRDIVQAWRSPLLILVLSLFAYLTASGLFIYLAPFSAFAQYSVILHTILGVVFLAPYVVYQTRHLLEVWNHPLWYVSAVGYTGGTALLVTVVSGVVLTIQALLGSKISAAWDFVHTVFGISAGVLLGVHLVEAFLVRLAARSRKLQAATTGSEGAASAGGAASAASPAARERSPIRLAAGRALAWSAGITALICGLTLALSLGYSGAPRTMELPEDYGYKYGENPFAPSMARTSTGGAIHPASLSDSKYCGDSGCHEQIVAEWEPSAHRYSSRSLFFQIVQKAMAQNNGAESTRYCAGCHDPIALFSGAKNIYDEDLSSPGADEGVSCASCHSIVETDVKGNADYVLDPPRRYLFEELAGPLARRTSKFLIRAYPRHHVDSYSRDLLKTPEFCGACHKQFIDEEINNVGWVQLQNQYDNWRKSHWFQPSEDDPSLADPKKTVSCRECHMRLTDSRDPASGDLADYNRSSGDAKHRNHRFIGANQWHPKLHDLPGWEEHIELTEEWLRGETEILEIADKWTTGPVIALDLVAPESVERGDEVTVHAIASSNKVGHDFPTGPLDIIQCWIELTVTDSAGRVVYESGTVDERGFIAEGSFMFKAEGVDKAGNLIDRHNLWDMVGARFRRSLFPGQSDRAEYMFVCPSALGRVAPIPREREFSFTALKDGELVVRARLRYRKVDQTLIDYLAPDSGLTAPITDISRAETRIVVADRADTES